MNQNIFQFASPDFLYALFIVPVFLLVYLATWYISRKSLRTFGDWELLHRLMPDASNGRNVFKFVLLQLSLVFIIIALARPQFGSKLQDVKRKGIELMIALDVSNSMRAEDIAPTRLDRAKQIIHRIIDKLHNDKVGLVVFAGQAYVQLPITTDYGAAKMFLATVNPDLMPRQGTAIGAAIELSMQSFNLEENQNNKALIIISDGENHEDDALGAAKKAAEAGVRVFTIGIGSPKGSPIPVIGKYGETDYQTDKQGSVVITKLNETMMQQIASAGNGMYLRAGSSNAGIKTILDELDKLTKIEIDAKVYAEYDERFQYAIGLAIFFLLLEYCILERKNRWLKKVNLFSNGSNLISDNALILHDTGK